MESREYSKVPRCHMQIGSPFKPKLCTKSCMGAKSLPSGQSQQTKCAISTQTICTRSNECSTGLHLYYNFPFIFCSLLHICSMYQTTLSGLCFVSHLSPSSKTLAILLHEFRFWVFIGVVHCLCQLPKLCANASKTPASCQIPCNCILNFSILSGRFFDFVITSSSVLLNIFRIKEGLVPRFWKSSEFK